jgi:nucleotide-binding universal stress UspA family protein
VKLPEIKKILYCTQLGPNAAYIFRHAYALAHKLGARITVLHVVETLTPRQEALVEGYAGAGALHAVVKREEEGVEARLRKRIQKFCTLVVGKPDCSDLVERIVVAEGHRPADVILRQVAETGADLVIMGAHAESTALASLMGSTAQRVVRKCPVPVLTVQVPEGQQELTLTD